MTNLAGLRILETFIGPCVLGSICSRATPLLSLGQMRKNLQIVAGKGMLQTWAGKLHYFQKVS